MRVDDHGGNRISLQLHQRARRHTTKDGNFRDFEKVRDIFMGPEIVKRISCNAFFGLLQWS
jgi:hypothetical protein